MFAAQQTDLQSDLNSLQSIDLQQFNSSSDIAYGLLSGTLDAGFVEADRLAAFSKLSGFKRLTVIGKKTYLYGATLVLRKDLNNRLNELDNLTVAASAPHCVLLEQITEDAQRFAADLSNCSMLAKLSKHILL